MASTAPSPRISGGSRTLTVTLTLLWCATALICWSQFPDFRSPAGFTFTHPQPAPAEPIVKRTFVTHGETREVHAASAVSLPGGDLLAVWYGGSREGAKDVSIYSARYDHEGARWSAPRKLLDRFDTARDVGRYVRKLGNPVLFQPSPGTLWLFYVSVSVGGWAGSSINLTVSLDEGDSWGASRRLVTSPFMNLSTLVKGPAFEFDNDLIGLPVYHEFIGKFGELLILDRSGKVVDKRRLSKGSHSLQPVIVPLDRKHALGVMRYAGSAPERVLQFESRDGGATFSAPEKSVLPNPNAAVSAVALPGGDVLMAFNDSEDERDNLRLARFSHDSAAWRTVATIEPDGTGQDETPEFSYPWLTFGPGGRIDLLYTWHQREIKHVQFNLAWLEQQGSIEGASP